MKRIALVILVLAVSACAIWPPGDDPRGKKMVANANSVLAAINGYRAKHGHNPESLQVLVPEFMSTVPVEPELNYQPQHDGLFFTYSPSWPQQGHVSCSAAFGAQSFGCIGYI